MQPTDLIAIGSVIIGAGGTASVGYFVERMAAAEAVTGPEGSPAAHYRERTWTFTCLAFADSLAARATLAATLRTSLVRRGVDVTFTEAGGTRQMLASAALPGFPEVRLGETTDRAGGLAVAFTLTATTREPIDQGDGLVEHTTERTFESDATGGVSTRVSGTVRLATGSAKDWVDTNVFAAARTAAGDAGQSFVTRVVVGLDAKLARYEMTSSARAANLGQGIVSATLDDVTARRIGAASVRRITGNAEGPEATSYAVAAAPTLGPMDVLVSDRVSAPGVPTGRVSFEYEVVRGVAVAGFGTAIVTGFDESFEPVPSQRPVQAFRFLSGPPVLYRGAQTEARYVQRSTVEYAGADADALGGLTGLLDDALLAAPPRVTYGPHRGPLRRITITREFISADDVSPLPAPRTVDFLA